MYKELENKHLFNIDKTIMKSLFINYKYPFEIIPNIKKEIIKIGNALDLNDYNKISKDIWISKKAIVCPNSCIEGPAIIDHNSTIKHCALIRGGVVVGQDCVVGNSSEIKNSILFDGVKVPHFNYVGDSILGYRVHLGAGVILSNLRLDKKSVDINYNSKVISTGLNKLGAIISDEVEVGCNSVLNPGTVVGPKYKIKPLQNIIGVVGLKMGNDNE